MLCPLGRLRNRRLLHGPTRFQCRSPTIMRACFPERGRRQSLIGLMVRFTFCKENSGCRSQSTWKSWSVSSNVQRVFRPQRAFHHEVDIWARTCRGRCFACRTSSGFVLVRSLPSFCTHLNRCLLYRLVSSVLRHDVNRNAAQEEGNSAEDLRKSDDKYRLPLPSTLTAPYAVATGDHIAFDHHVLSFLLV